MNLETYKTVTLANERNPGAVSLDKINKRVYWQDENRGISSIRYDRQKKMTVRNGLFNRRLLGIFAGSAYFQEANVPYINQMNISSGEISHSHKLNETAFIDLVVVHNSLQPMTTRGELKDNSIIRDLPETCNLKLRGTNYKQSLLHLLSCVGLIAPLQGQFYLQG
jgi:hypothetical protein